MSGAKAEEQVRGDFVEIRLEETFCNSAAAFCCARMTFRVGVRVRVSIRVRVRVRVGSHATAPI